MKNEDIYDAVNQSTDEYGYEDAVDDADQDELRQLLDQSLCDRLATGEVDPDAAAYLRDALQSSSPDIKPTPGILAQTPKQRAKREEEFKERLLYLTRKGRF